jgi:hypothetical protein
MSFFISTPSAVTLRVALPILTGSGLPAVAVTATSSYVLPLIVTAGIAHILNFHQF